MSMIWIKTDIGRAEICTRALVPERVRRNLLLLIDGNRSQDALLNSVAGSTAGDIDQLAQLGLITRVRLDETPVSAFGRLQTQASAMFGSTSTEMDLLLDERPTPSYAQLTARLTHLISSELGLRGFRLTLAVEKAADVQQLMPVVDRVVADIAQRKGAAAAEKARQLIFSS
jgi:hypothetical protein